MKPEVIIVDYGLGNILSICRAFEHVGASVKISSNHSEISRAERVVLPGVGAFPKGMTNLVDLGLEEALLNAAGKSTPILGICLGMQLLFETSMEHEKTSGLGLLSGAVGPLFAKKGINTDCIVPSVGWMRINTSKTNSFVKNFERKYFYFVHSFAANPKNKCNIVAEYKNCDENIVAAVQKDNIYGVQFHPEKSGREGLLFLENWVNF